MLTLSKIEQLSYNQSMFSNIWKRFADAKQADKIDGFALEEELLLANVSYPAAAAIASVVDNEENQKQAVQSYLLDILTPLQYEMRLQKETQTTVLVIGINGSGKTTSIAKLAHWLIRQNKKVMLAAGDTFRAAAIEQLQYWGDRVSAPVIAQQSGADSAAVIYDAMESARAKSYDILLADTAGRLHSNENLMRELERIVRVMRKFDEEAPQEVFLVCDATGGSNLVQQVKSFNELVPISALIYTKTDVAAKCGAVLSVAYEHKLPIAFFGNGEKLEDFASFKAESFVGSLFDD